MPKSLYPSGVPRSVDFFVFAYIVKFYRMWYDISIGGRMMDAKTTGKIISKKRKALGMTQKELADILNVSNRTVSKWETGDGYPDISILPELSAKLEISIDELLTGEKPEPIIIEKPSESSEKKLHGRFMIAEIVAFSLHLRQMRSAA